MFVCPHCNIELRGNFLQHLKVKHSDKFISEGDMILFDLRIRGKFIERDVLYEEYVIKKLSYPDLRKKYKIDFKSIKKLLDVYGIASRSLSEAYEYSKDKQKKTTNERYGVDNPSQSDVVKEKKRQTFLKNYGVDNVWKLKNYHEQCNLIHYEKYGETLDEKRSKTLKLLYDGEYGKKRRIEMSEVSKQRWSNMSDEEIELATQHLKRIGKSSLETRVENLLKEAGFLFDRQFYLGGKFFDIRLGDTLIEVNGDFWHANPEKYSADDKLAYPKGDVEAKSLWKKDKEKRKIAESKGFTVKTLWENDIKRMSDEELLIEVLKI